VYDISIYRRATLINGCNNWKFGIENKKCKLKIAKKKKVFLKEKGVNNFLCLGISAFVCFPPCLFFTVFANFRIEPDMNNLARFLFGVFQPNVRQSR